MPYAFVTVPDTVGAAIYIATPDAMVLVAVNVCLIYTPYALVKVPVVLVIVGVTYTPAPVVMVPPFVVHEPVTPTTPAIAVVPDVTVLLLFA